MASAAVALGADVPTVSTSGGMVTANHHLAAEVGAQVLAEGGNAVDAAVATSFALGVVEPAMSGIGGRGYLVVLPAGAAIPTVFDGHERAPIAAFPDMFEPLPVEPSHTFGWGDEIRVTGDLNRTGPLAVATPGVVGAIADAHRCFGQRSFASLLGPAIKLAQDGFRVDAHLANLIAEHRDRLARFPDAAELFLPGGRPLRDGDLLVQPELAGTLRRLAERGPEDFYTGDTARAIATHVVGSGGLLASTDLRNFRPWRWPAPLSAVFAGHQVHGVPGAAGTISVAQILGVLSGFPELLAGEVDTAYLHVLLEACRLGYLDRADHVGDGMVEPVPWDGLLAEPYLARLRDLISKERRLDPRNRPDPWQWQPTQLPDDRVAPAVGDDSHTTHFCVVDSSGNAVSMTQSLIDAFGSCVVVPGTGMLLNSAMHNFVPVPGRRGSIAPGKRSTHNGSPLIVTDADGGLRLAVGGAGGTRVVTGLVQVLVDVLVRGSTLQAALSAPRVHNDGGVASEVDARFPAPIIAGLTARGHSLLPRLPEYGRPAFSRINGIEIDPGGVRHSGIDPYVRSGAVSSDIQ